MLRIIGILILAGIALAALKLAIVLLILGGLIFRTKETIGVLAFLLIAGLISKFPVITLSSMAVLLAIGVYLKHRERRREVPPAPPIPRLFSPPDSRNES